MDGIRFAGLAGNDNVKRRLSAFVDAGQFPHALLLEGPVGSGRRHFAHWLAKAAVCTGEEKPCGACSACRKAESGHHPDIAVYGGDGTARSIHVETVREIRESAYIRPNEAARRVIVLAGAEGMTEQAQNALLRILEDPPAHLLFILTGESRSRLLPTIQSRVQCLTLSGVRAEEALPVLKERLPHADEEELFKALTVFDGCIGRVIEAMEGETFPRVLALTPEMAAAVVAPTEWPLLKLTAALDRDRALQEGVLGGLLLVFRDALSAQNGQRSRLSTAPETAELLAQRLTGDRLLRLMETVQSLQKAQRGNMSPSLLLTQMCARLRAAAGQ